MGLKWSPFLTLPPLKKTKQKKQKKTRPCRPSRRAVWIVKRMRYRPTNRPTDRPTDTASYRGALAHLKSQFVKTSVLPPSFIGKSLEMNVRVHMICHGANEYAILHVKTIFMRFSFLPILQYSIKMKGFSVIMINFLHNRTDISMICVWEVETKGAKLMDFHKKLDFVH